jgi:branched-chain amino acid transport system ATP-binding protein
VKVPLLSLEDISVSYAGVPALRNLSLTVERGEVVCLVGSNGSGKSTTLKALVGLVPLAGGSISFSGRKLSGMRTEAIIAQGIGIAPEGRRIFPGLTVLENLKIGAALQQRHDLGSRLEEIYGLFPRLAERKRQMGWSLSGGEQQMLAIGRALMGRPSLLVLDEPSLGLAPLMTQELFRTIGEVAKRGTSVLLVEQNVQIALSVANRGYVLETGNLVLQGRADELVRHPKVRAAFLGN